MIRALVTNLKGIVGALALAGCLISGPARAQVEVVVGPPPEVLATTTPVIYEGRPAYWWGGRWYFRDGPGWGYYRDEPGFLRDYRGHHEFRPHYYGRGGWGGRGRGRDRR